MSFWNKSTDKKNDADKPKHADLGRNDPCHCGSGKKYKKCCMAKDEAADHKAVNETWEKNAAAAASDKEQTEKKTKDAPTTAPKPSHTQQSTKQQHPSFIPSQVNMPRKSGGGA